MLPDCFASCGTEMRLNMADGSVDKARGRSQPNGSESLQIAAGRRGAPFSVMMTEAEAWKEGEFCLRDA